MNTKLIITATASIAAIATGIVLLVKNHKEAKVIIDELSDAMAESSIDAINKVAATHPHNEEVQAQAKKSIDNIAAASL
mgnify:CR=1 FL=1